MAKKPLTKIIIVDDDTDILKILEFSLELMEGVTVKYCNSGQDGIKEALLLLPDLMVIDVMMPNMDGITMVQAMRLIPALAHVPVIFLTAKMQPEEIDHYHEIGVKEVITKPFDPLTLPDTLMTIWNKISAD